MSVQVGRRVWGTKVTLMRATCKNCGVPIDRANVRAEVAKLDIPETADRAANVSVFCGIVCAFEDFGKGARRLEEP